MNRFLQAKTFGKCRPSHSTHERLFTKHEKPRKAVREQFIRDRELEGRPYDIVGHYTIERLPSHVPQRREHAAGASVAERQEGRCTQGSLGWGGRRACSVFARAGERGAHVPAFGSVAARSVITTNAAPPAATRRRPFARRRVLANKRPEVGRRTGPRVEIKFRTRARWRGGDEAISTRMPEVQGRGA